MTDSRTLLAEYVKDGSEPAFRELVTRYVNLVYSAAVRLVEEDRHLAEDVVQTVFADLARMARSLPNDVLLGGWLHRHTCFVAATLLRGERRRRARERQAVEMNALEDHPEANLALVTPMLDEAINQLGAADRTAILLRFFEQHDFRSVGEALGSNEDAARMRVKRALEKLHSLLKHRGVTLSVAALGTVLTAEAVTAAPAGLAVTISSIALAGASAGTATTFTILKLMAKTKLKLGLTTLVIAGAATTLVIQHQAQTKLGEENQSFRHQIAQLKADNESLSSLAAQAKKLASLPSDQFTELLRLRGEVGMLRQQTNELGKLRQENRKLLSQIAAQPESTNQLSAEDQFTLQQTHVVDAMTTLLKAIENYAANHNGQYPGSVDQLTASGAVGVSNFAGNLRLDDFEFMKAGAVDFQGRKLILRNRVPIPRSNVDAVWVYGSLDGGYPSTEIIAADFANIDPRATQNPPPPNQ